MPTIAIIGAGCAGLGAAYALLRSDVNLRVILIEATGRMGGRAITSTTFEQLPVDLGPQFIQDPDINPWKTIATQLGYGGKLMQPDMNAYYRMSEGAVWSDMFTTPGIQAANNVLDEQYRKACGYRNAPAMTGNAPAFCEGQQNLRLALGSNGLGAIAESAEPWQYVARDRERQDDVDAGANIYVAGGLGTMVAAFGKRLSDIFGPALQYVSPVVADRIDNSDPAKVAIHAVGVEDPYSADFCIVTVPCSELAKIAFDPPLPGEMERAADYIRLGSYKKVAFQPTQFPDADGPDPLNEETEYYIYKAPAREDDDPEKPLLADTGGTWQYFRLPTDPTILICVASGNFAHRLDGLPDNQVSDSVIALLTEAYPGGNFAPQGGRVVVTNWTNAPYVHGAYSYTRYDEALGAADPFPLEARELIAKPHGRIHFAGEASWIPAYGTIQGAYWSGKRAAREILKIIRGR